MKILVTGAAGFIGMHTAKRFALEGHEVVGVDNFNHNVEVELKQDRIDQLKEIPLFRFERLDLGDHAAVSGLFQREHFDIVIHLAAQAGVRYSLINPHAYIQSNVNGFLNVLEGCRNGGVTHLVYASSSSVYGANTKMPFHENDSVNHPVSLYAASKKSNELMAHSYSHLFGLPTTGLRFFTVYGPWGRPDMAYSIFTRKILAGEPIDLFNYGNMKRDFTYVDDIVEGIVKAAFQPPAWNPQWDTDQPEPGASYAPYSLYNIGNNRSVELLEFVRILERLLGKEARINLLPIQKGDVVDTYASIDKLHAFTGFTPVTGLEEGLQKFVSWYVDYYRT